MFSILFCFYLSLTFFACTKIQLTRHLINTSACINKNNRHTRFSVSAITRNKPFTNFFTPRFLSSVESKKVKLIKNRDGGEFGMSFWKTNKTSYLNHLVLPQNLTALTKRNECFLYLWRERSKNNLLITRTRDTSG